MNQSKKEWRPNRITSPIVALNDREFVAILDHIELMKYSTITHKWTLILRFSHLTKSYCADSMVVDPQRNMLYILRRDECSIVSMTVMDVLSGSILQQHTLSDFPDGITLVNVDGTIHRIGGVEDHHVIWNEVQGDWDQNVIHRFPCTLNLDTSAVYVKSKNIILMTGAEEIGLWRFQIATSNWEHVEMSWFEHHGGTLVLTSDQQNVIVVDWNAVYVLSVQDDDDYTLRMLIETRVIGGVAPAYAVLMNDRTEMLVLTTGWIRHMFGKQLECPAVIIKLIQQFVSRESLHLISRGRNSSGSFTHVALDLQSDLWSESVESEAVVVRNLPPLWGS